MDYEKKYKNAIKSILEWREKYGFTKLEQYILEGIFSELKESDNTDIRTEIKNIITYFYGSTKLFTHLHSKEELLTWLEKQGNQDNDEDIDILHRFSFYSYKDEPNVLYLSGFYVNEEFRNKGIGTKILEVADKVAKSLGCNVIRLKTKKDSNAERLYRIHGYNSLALAIEDKDEIWLEKQDEQKPIKEHDVCDTCEEKASCVIPCPMKLVGQKPTDWSKDDENNINSIVSRLEVDISYWESRSKTRTNEDKKLIEWLKFLKDRYTWKPSDEQMKALENAMSMGARLDSLYNDLKKLRKE